MKTEQLINKENPLDKDFIPDDLFQTDDNKDNFHHYKNPDDTPKVSAKILINFIVMQEKAFEDGHKIIVDSGYRSFRYQQTIWDKNIEEKGLEETKKYVAIPGTSEHQSGLAIDIACLRGKNNTYDDDIKEDDPEVKWLIDNAHKYGFILRYPKEKESITKFNFEAWHFRYVGTKAATIIKKNNLTLEEYVNKKEKWATLLNEISEPTFLTMFHFMIAHYIITSSLMNYQKMKEVIKEYKKLILK